MVVPGEALAGLLSDTTTVSSGSSSESSATVMDMFFEVSPGLKVSRPEVRL